MTLPRALIQEKKKIILSIRNKQIKQNKTKQKKEQTRQAFINSTGLGKSVSLGLRLRLPFTPCKIHQIHTHVSLRFLSCIENTRKIANLGCDMIMKYGKKPRKK
jgi:hypothetical protein